MGEKVITIALAFLWLSVVCSCAKGTNSGGQQPNITTAADVAMITTTSAVCTGVIGSIPEGTIISRGICWSTTATPTISDNKTTEGSGTGSFTSTLNGLHANQKYYYRAYASGATKTYYGDVKYFFTLTAPVADCEGNSYNVIRIGDRFWTKENLRTDMYCDGTPIKNAVNNAQWAADTTGAYGVYGDEKIYGKLYNYYAIANTNGKQICPNGWHIPTRKDFQDLENMLGGYSRAASPLKAISPLWIAPNADATDSTGFSALPAGYRTFYGDYYNLGQAGYFYASDKEIPIIGGTTVYILTTGSVMLGDNQSGDPHTGVSCRCINNQ